MQATRKNKNESDNLFDAYEQAASESQYSDFAQFQSHVGAVIGAALIDGIVSDVQRKLRDFEGR